MKRFATILALAAVALANEHVLVNPGLYSLGNVYNPYVASPLVYGRPVYQLRKPELELREKKFEEVNVYKRPEEQLKVFETRPVQKEVRPEQVTLEKRPEINVYEKKPGIVFEKRPEIQIPYQVRPEVNVYEKKAEIQTPYQVRPETTIYKRPEEFNTVSVFPGFKSVLPIRYAANSGRVQHVVSKREAESNVYLANYPGYPYTTIPTPYYATTQYIYPVQEQPKTYISPVGMPEQKTVADYASALTPAYADKARFFADSVGARMIAKRSSDSDSFYPYSNFYARSVYNPAFYSSVPYTTGYPNAYTYGYPYVY